VGLPGSAGIGTVLIIEGVDDARTGLGVLLIGDEGQGEKDSSKCTYLGCAVSRATRSAFLPRVLNFCSRHIC
jgi:hypothetical protein